MALFFSQITNDCFDDFNNKYDRYKVCDFEIKGFDSNAHLTFITGRGNDVTYVTSSNGVTVSPYNMVGVLPDDLFDESLTWQESSVAFFTAPDNMYNSKYTHDDIVEFLSESRGYKEATTAHYFEMAGCNMIKCAANLVEGVGVLGEGVYDTLNLGASIVKTPILALWDGAKNVVSAFTGEEYESSVKKDWERTIGNIEDTFVMDSFDDFYANNEFGIKLKESRNEMKELQKRNLANLGLGVANVVKYGGMAVEGVNDIMVTGAVTIGTPLFALWDGVKNAASVFTGKDYDSTTKYMWNKVKDNYSTSVVADFFDYLNTETTVGKALNDAANQSLAYSYNGEIITYLGANTSVGQ